MDQTLKGHLRVKKIATVISLAVGVGSVWLGYERLQPAPVAYLRGDVNTADRPGQVEDPKLELKFGNVGFGPMYLYRLQFVQGNGSENVISKEQALGFNDEDNLTLSSASDVFHQFHSPKPWAASHPVTLATIRPKDRDSATVSKLWEDSAKAELHGRETFLLVEYSWTNATWWPRKKAWLGIASHK